MIFIVLLFSLLSVGNVYAAHLSYSPEKEKSPKFYATKTLYGPCSALKLSASVEILNKYTKCTRSSDGDTLVVTALERTTGRYFSKTNNSSSRLWGAYGIGDEWVSYTDPKKDFADCMAAFKSLAPLTTRVKLWKELRKIENEKPSADEA